MQKLVFDYDQKWEGVQYIEPKKSIITMNDVEVFKKKKIFSELVTFLADLQQSIKGKKISETKKNQRFQIFQQFFSTLSKLLDETPPIQQPMRFGNRAFKDYHAKVQAYTSEFLDKILPEPLTNAKGQLYRYIVQSFGSNVRIDYGTGHQLSFMFFCWALFRLGFYPKEQHQQMVRQLFYEYINLMRKIQVQYKLEPAGSHGVWGLDDYHFLPFLLGGAQIVGNPVLASPLCIHNDILIEENYKEYMYLRCVKFIKQEKKGVPFSESSPILDNISGAASWEKVMGGMVKMYQVEVLGKHPAIKHAFFGTIIPYE